MAADRVAVRIDGRSYRLHPRAAASGDTSKGAKDAFIIEWHSCDQLTLIAEDKCEAKSSSLCEDVAIISLHEASARFHSPRSPERRRTLMGSQAKVPPLGFEAWSVDEQIDYVQTLWDQIAARPETVPVPRWHRDVLDQRLADLKRDPDEGIPWDAFRAELQSNDDQQKG